jgi:hypothetical protein
MGELGLWGSTILASALPCFSSRSLANSIRPTTMRKEWADAALVEEDILVEVDYLIGLFLEAFLYGKGTANLFA